jgi:hypothetical protein
MTTATSRIGTTNAVKPIEVSADLKALMRRLKLGRLLDTLPERLALARTNHLPHHDFLEMLLAELNGLLRRASKEIIPTV